MESGKKIYFASDVHLGLPDREKSLVREKLFVKWLDEIKNDAAEIYLLGDIFDFWYEYKFAVPRGFTRFLGKISEITDSGIPIHFFTGNHDLWAFDYLPQETGVILHRKTLIKEFNGKKFFIAHGDGLGPFEYKYKFLKSIFTNPIVQWFYSRLHPNFGIGFATTWSRFSRNIQEFPKFMGEDKEWLVQYAKIVLKKDHYDHFVFGHRHVPISIKLSETSHFTNLGDWIYNYTYAVFDGTNLELKKYS